jgi:regulator of replication initiation timing
LEYVLGVPKGTSEQERIVDIDIDLQAIIDEVLERNKQLILENIILKKALEQVQALDTEAFSADTA